LRERLPGKFGRTVMAIAVFAAAAMLAVAVVALIVFAVQRQLRGKPREHQKASHPPTADCLDSAARLPLRHRTVLSRVSERPQETEQCAYALFGLVHIDFMAGTFDHRNPCVWNRVANRDLIGERG
jgi:hypothetical protein